MPNKTGFNQSINYIVAPVKIKILFCHVALFHVGVNSLYMLWYFGMYILNLIACFYISVETKIDLDIRRKTTLRLIHNEHEM